MPKHAKLVEDAKRDPSRIYTSPSDVLRDRRLNDAERVEILATWERDARALSVATEEAMGGGEPSRLREVIEARQEAEKRLPDGGPHERDDTKFGGDGD